LISNEVSGKGVSSLVTGQGGQAWELIHRNATYLSTTVYGFFDRYVVDERPGPRM
jgi:hypothetical protein